MYRGKILAITDAPYCMTGYGNQANKILTELVNRGWDVYAFSGNYFPNGTEPVNEEGYAVYNGIKTILLPNIWKSPDNLYPSKEEVKAAYDKINPDIVWSFNDFYRVADYLNLGEEFINRWIHWLPIDNDYDDKYTATQEDKMKFIAFMSEFGKRMEGPKLPNVKYKPVVYAGIDENVFKPKDKNTVKVVNGNYGKFVIVTVAKHQPRKMVYHTAHAVGKFMQKHKDAVWLCKSDPNDNSMKTSPESERDLKGIMNSYGVLNQTIFIDRALPEEFMNDLYNNGDVFISLSGGEGFNVPVAESMMAGVPCIITDNTVAPEITAGGRFGFLIPVLMKKYIKSFNMVYDIANMDEAAACLEYCYNDWQGGSLGLKSKGNAAREFALKNFGLNNIVDKWEEEFQTIIRNNNPVLWHSFFGKGVGFTAISETIIPALEKLGYDVYINDWLAGLSPITEPYFREKYNKYLLNEKKINFSKQPQILCWLMETFNAIDGEYKIGWSLLESTKVRRFYIDQCNGMDYIVTSAEHNKQIQKDSGIINPIYIVPPCVDSKKFPELDRGTIEKLPDGSYMRHYSDGRNEVHPLTFLHIGVVQERKNPTMAIDGYIAAFPDNGKTQFILKSNDFGELSWFENHYASRKDVKFVYTKVPLTQEELLNLYREADVYVNLSHGEGIGMPDIEALATGLPVIGSNWDARKVFLDEDVGWMLKVVGMGPAYTQTGDDCGQWAHYDGWNYVDILRDIGNNPTEARRKGRNGSERVRTKFTPEKAALALDSLLMDVYRKKKMQMDASKFTDQYYSKINKYSNEYEKEAQLILNATEGLNGKVLDVGCGRGYLMKHLLPRGKNIIGIDISKYAAQNPIEEARGKIIFGDIRKTSFKEKEFDWCILENVLEYIPEEYLEEVFKEISRIAKKSYIKIKVITESGEEQSIAAEDPARVTIHPMSWWNERLNRAGMSVIVDKQGYLIVEDVKFVTNKVNYGDRILVGIPTKDRAKSLARLLNSLAEQTYKNFDIKIVDDSRYDHVHEDPDVTSAIQKLYSVGIPTWLVRGKEINQAVAHNQIMEHGIRMGYKLVYRVDDDVTLEPNNIEMLLNEFVKDEKCEYAAVGGIILNATAPADQQFVPANWRDLIEFKGDINPCTFWAQVLKYPEDVDERTDIKHLYSSYMYRPELVKSVGGFPYGLSPVASREETIPMYELYLKGYKLKIKTKAYANHFFEGKGGCRSVDPKMAQSLYVRDESVFMKKIKQLQDKYKKS